MPNADLFTVVAWLQQESCGFTFLIKNQQQTPSQTQLICGVLGLQCHPDSAIHLQCLRRLLESIGQTF